MIFRYCVPRVAKRGYGLGNEFIPWARAFLASRLLRAKLLPPAFALNRRRYWRQFDTPLDDWIRNRAIEHLLPAVEFTEADYLEHGGGDVVNALRGFAKARGLYDRASYVLTTTGIWGGLKHIAQARDFIRATLYQSHYAAGNLLQLQRRIDPEKILVGLHVRLGDFRAPGSLSDYGKVANMSLPIEWFANIAATLTAKFGSDLQFLLVSDGSAEDLKPLTNAFNCVTSGDLANSDCSDLLALANSDLLVCSASTFSSLAAFLSDSPYLWFAPNLHLHAEGCYSLGSFEDRRGAERAAIVDAVAAYARSPHGWQQRGSAVGLDGALPSGLTQSVTMRRDRRQWRFDLVNYGVCAQTCET